MQIKACMYKLHPDRLRHNTAWLHQSTNTALQLPICVGLKKEDAKNQARDYWQSGVNPATLVYGDKTGSKLDWWWWL